MAYNNNSQIKYPITKGSLSFMNADSEFEKSKLAIDYWNGMIKLSIYPMIERSSKDEFPRFNENEGTSAYLRPTKAHVLMNEITKFMKDPTAVKNAGIRSGDNIILINNPERYPKASNYVLTIIKLVPKSNEIKEMYHYEFKGHYHCGIRNYDITSSKFDTAYEYDTLEINELVTTLKAFVEASTSAYSAEMIYKDTFTRNRYNEKINAIAKNLGVDISYKYNSSSSYSNGGYSKGSGNVSYPSYNSPSNRYVADDDDDVPF